MNAELDKEQLLSFGRTLKKVRTKKKLSYRQLAQLCDVDHSDLSKIEKGQIDVRLSTVFDIARALEVEPKALLDF